MQIASPSCQFAGTVARRTEPHRAWLDTMRTRFWNTCAMSLVSLDRKSWSGRSNWQLTLLPLVARLAGICTTLHGHARRSGVAAGEGMQSPREGRGGSPRAGLVSKGPAREVSRLICSIYCQSSREQVL